MLVVEAYYRWGRTRKWMPIIVVADTVHGTWMHYATFETAAKAEEWLALFREKDKNRKSIDAEMKYRVVTYGELL
jgi:hypothetical protein